MANVLMLNVAELLRHPGSRRQVALTVPIADLAADGLSVLDARVSPDAMAVIDVEVEALHDGIVVTGDFSAPWEADCRRCLSPARGTLSPHVRELYRVAPQPDDDAFPLDHEQLDLGPLVSEALTLDLPLAPLCRPGCAGLCPVCGADLNDGDCGCDRTVSDPRWAALDVLRDELEQES